MLVHGKICQKLRYCVCKLPDDHTRYISCSACGRWYHTRCCNINSVLISFETKNINSAFVQFYCGTTECNSSECYCVYRKKNGHIKFPWCNIDLRYHCNMTLLEGNTHLENQKKCNLEGTKEKNQIGVKSNDKSKRDDARIKEAVGSVTNDVEDAAQAAKDHTNVGETTNIVCQNPK